MTNNRSCRYTESFCNRTGSGLGSLASQASEASVSAEHQSPGWREQLWRGVHTPKACTHPSTHTLLPHSRAAGDLRRFRFLLTSLTAWDLMAKRNHDTSRLCPNPARALSFLSFFLSLYLCSWTKWSWFTVTRLCAFLLLAAALVCLSYIWVSSDEGKQHLECCCNSLLFCLRNEREPVITVS